MQKEIIIITLPCPKDILKLLENVPHKDPGLRKEVAETELTFYS